MYYIGEDGWPKLESMEEEEDSDAGEETAQGQFKNVFQQDLGGVLCLMVKRDENLLYTSVEPVIALFGIIDILQTYDPAKCSEHWFKRLYIEPKACRAHTHTAPRRL